MSYQYYQDFTVHLYAVLSVKSHEQLTYYIVQPII